MASTQSYFDYMKENPGATFSQWEAQRAKNASGNYLQTSTNKHSNSTYGLSPETAKLSSKGLTQTQLDNLEMGATEGYGTNGYNPNESFQAGTGGLALKLGTNGQYNTAFWSPEQWQKFGETGGTIGANGEVNLGIGSNSGTGMSAGDIASLVNAGTGILNTGLAYKNYGLAKDSFNFEKASTNRNLANQGLAYNTALDKQTANASALGGLSAAQSQQRLDANKSKYMNTNPIG